MRILQIRPGDVVVIGGFDDIPEHQFRVEKVYQVSYVSGFGIDLTI